MDSWCVPLQELCYKVIIRNFSRFTEVFLTTVDERLKKNFLFLQRRYSQKLLDELIERDKLKEDHLNFLLNKYLKTICINKLLCCSSKENIIDKVVPISHSLTELSCGSSDEENDCVTTLTTLLPHLVSVTKLRIHDVCNDEMLQIIASSCPHLTHLDIRLSRNISDLGVQALCACPGGQAPCPLISLDLKFTGLSEENVGNILKNIPTIQELNFKYVPAVLYSLHKADLDNNVLSEAQKYNLSSLEFGSIHDSSMAEKQFKICAEVCPHIKNVCVYLEGNYLHLCCLFNELDTISVAEMRDDYATDLNSFFKIIGGKLKNFDADGCSLSVSTLIQNCPNLVHLLLDTCNYIKPDKDITCKLRSLIGLQFDLGHASGGHPGKESLEMLLSSSPNLEILQLDNCIFKDSEIFHMLIRYFKNCSLKHLCFYESDVEIHLLLQIVLSCRRLQSLSLYHCVFIRFHDIRHAIYTMNRKIKLDFTNSKIQYSDF